MKIAVVIARILLGLPFLIFGLNDFFHFIPMQPIPGDAGVLVTIMYTHGWLIFHGLLYVIAGVLLVVGRYVPVALVILSPAIGAAPPPPPIHNYRTRKSDTLT